MHDDTVKLVEAFFTSDRLARYRSLHEVFPLWCGAWPSPHVNESEFTYWSGILLHEAALDEATSGRNALAVLEEWEDQGVRFLVPRTTDGPAETMTLSATHLALRRAITLTFPQLTNDSQGSQALTEHWLTSLRSLSDPDHFIRSYGWITIGPEPVNLWHFQGLVRRLQMATTTETNRQDLVREITKYWERIGKEIGAIPRLSPGKCNLPDEFLDALRSQGRDLLEEVSTFNPSGDWTAAVQALMEEPDDVGELQRERLASLRRQANHDPEAGRLLREEEARVDRTSHITVWSRRLAFPMLTPSEIGRIVEGAQSLERLANELTAQRLPISPKTLENRISASR